MDNFIYFTFFKEQMLGCLALIGLVVALVAYIYFFASKTKEQFDEGKMPISDFTYDYIKTNACLNDQNKIYKNVLVMSNGTKVLASQPSAVQGEILIPKTYTSWWR